jgi:photosystem II stability/assembly factor-like uncharacterized protein
MTAHAPTKTRAFAWLLCLACAVACAAVVATAQQSERAWVWQNPLPQGNAIYAVRFASDKRTGWAVGADGVILHTVDGGFRWEEQHAQMPVPLYGLYVKDAKTAVAVGARGLILTTSNGGRRWVTHETGAKAQGANHLYSVSFAPDALRGWAVGSYGEIVKTYDGGRTWLQQKSGVRAHLYSVAFWDISNGVAAGDNGTLLVTHDGGERWEEHTVKNGLPFTAVTFAGSAR